MFRAISVFLVGAFVACTSLQAASVDDAKADLLDVIAEYAPGAPVTDEMTARISAAADRLEKAVGAPPNLLETPELVTGQWMSLFSSQGVVGEIDVSFMTRAHKGGGVEGGKATSLVVLQELRPAQRFYRNMMVMRAGKDDTPLLHIATADLGIDTDQPNVLEVSFRTLGFAPARADVTPADLREALSLPPSTELAIELPPGRISRSTVTYLDADLRVNRGKTYIAVLRKVD